MPATPLFDDSNHRNILMSDAEVGEAVRTHQHLIVDGKAALLIDPGGERAYAQVKRQTTGLLEGRKLEAILLSHLDPTVVAAVGGWLLTTDATVYVPRIWLEFMGDLGLDRVTATRFKPVPDEGMWLQLGSARIAFVPAHFLYSPGNFQVWDPTARILYTGALGSATGEGAEVTDFDAHSASMQAWHQRLMAGTRAIKAWIRMARTLPIEVIAPREGPCYKGAAMVARFVDWCDSLVVGTDLLPDEYDVPTLTSV